MTNPPDSPPQNETAPASPGPSFSARLTSAQDLVVRVIVEALAALVLVMLVWVVLGVARDVLHAVISSEIGAFKDLTVELLTVFVFIELFHSLTEYVRFRRIRVTTLIDASLAFVLREMWIGMYSGHMDWRMLAALSGLILALGGVRTLAVVYSPSERAADLAEV